MDGTISGCVRVDDVALHSNVSPNNPFCSLEQKGHYESNYQMPWVIFFGHFLIVRILDGCEHLHLSKKKHRFGFYVQTEAPLSVLGSFIFIRPSTPTP